MKQASFSISSSQLQPTHTPRQYVTLQSTAWLQGTSIKCLNMYQVGPPKRAGKIWAYLGLLTPSSEDPPVGLKSVSRGTTACTALAATMVSTFSSAQHKHAVEGCASESRDPSCRCGAAPVFASSVRAWTALRRPGLLVGSAVTSLLRVLMYSTRRGTCVGCRSISGASEGSCCLTPGQASACSTRQARASLQACTYLRYRLPGFSWCVSPQTGQGRAESVRQLALVAFPLVVIARVGSSHYQAPRTRSLPRASARHKQRGPGLARCCTSCDSLLQGRSAFKVVLSSAGALYGAADDGCAFIRREMGTTTPCEKEACRPGVIGCRLPVACVHLEVPYEFRVVDRQLLEASSSCIHPEGRARTVHGSSAARQIMLEYSAMISESARSSRQCPV